MDPALFVILLILGVAAALLLRLGQAHELLGELRRLAVRESNRLRRHARAMDDHRLSHHQLGLRKPADVDAAIHPRLADGDRDADIRRTRRRADRHAADPEIPAHAGLDRRHQIAAGEAAAVLSIADAGRLVPTLGETGPTGGGASIFTE